MERAYKKSVEPFSLLLSDVPDERKARRKQSYSTPAGYEVHNEQKPTDDIVTDRRSVHDLPLLCLEIVRISDRVGEKHFRNM